MALRTAERPGQTIGQYDLLEKIAEGGMGTVYKGRHRLTSNLVAIKVVKPTLLENPVLVQRFEQEFRVSHSLNHPNIVRGLEFCREGEARFLVMEYVDGENLGNRIEHKGALPVDEAIRIIGDVAQGLHQAHQQGIIHRDVKPDNILLTLDGKAKLTDLGLVKNAAGSMSMTQTGRGLGTPHFMAPEQFRNAKAADARCDVYSLGATLYTMVTGVEPFKSSSPVDAFLMKIHNEFKPPRALVPYLPERIDRAIRRAMAADPAERPASCLEFMADLTGSHAIPLAANGPKAESAKPLRCDRRATIRYPSGQGGHCHAIGGDEQVRWVAKVQDISVTGIAVILRRRFEPRTVLTLEIKAKDQSVPHRLLVRVVRVQPLSRRRWLVGCTFARKLSKEEVESLV